MKTMYIITIIIVAAKAVMDALHVVIVVFVRHHFDRAIAMDIVIVAAYVFAVYVIYTRLLRRHA